MKFLFDQCFPHHFVAVLRILYPEDSEALQHLEKDLKFGGVEDLVWIPKLDKTFQWIIFTRDSRLRKRKLEKQAWKNAGHVVVFFEGPWAHANTHEQAWRVLRWWPTLKEVANRANPGEGFQAPFRGQPKRLVAIETP